MEAGRCGSLTFVVHKQHYMHTNNIKRSSFFHARFCREWVVHATHVSALHIQTKLEHSKVNAHEQQQLSGESLKDKMKHL